MRGSTDEGKGLLGRLSKRGTGPLDAAGTDEAKKKEEEGVWCAVSSMTLETPKEKRSSKKASLASGVGTFPPVPEDEDERYKGGEHTNIWEHENHSGSDDGESSSSESESESASDGEREAPASSEPTSSQPPRWLVAEAKHGMAPPEARDEEGGSRGSGKGKRGSNESSSTTLRVSFSGEDANDDDKKEESTLKPKASKVSFGGDEDDNDSNERQRSSKQRVSFGEEDEDNHSQASSSDQSGSGTRPGGFGGKGKGKGRGKGKMLMRRSQTTSVADQRLRAKTKAFEELEDSVPLTKRSSFLIGMAVILIVNAVTLGLEADHGPKHKTIFLITENFFTVIFIVELVLRLKCEGPREYFTGDSMNWLDFGLVLLGVLGVWLIPFLKVDADLRVLSVLRLLRLIRLAQLIRFVPAFRELGAIVSGLMKAIRALFWAGLFLVMLVYAFAIFARLMIGKAMLEEEEKEAAQFAFAAGETCGAFSRGIAAGHRYLFNEEIGDQAILFGSVERSMLTLFVCLTEGCGIDVVHPTTRVSPELMLFWGPFVFLTTYGICNLIVGIFCEHAMETATETESELLARRDAHRMRILDQVMVAFRQADTDESGEISREEYEEAVKENELVMEALEILGLAEEENLFDLLDADGGGSVTFEEFFDGVMLFTKGQESAKAKDIVPTYLRVNAIASGLGKVEERMEELISRLPALPPPVSANSQEGAGANGGEGRGGGGGGGGVGSIGLFRAAGNLISAQQKQQRGAAGEQQLVDPQRSWQLGSGAAAEVRDEALLVARNEQLEEQLREGSARRKLLEARIRQLEQQLLAQDLQSGTVSNDEIYMRARIRKLEVQLLEQQFMGHDEAKRTQEQLEQQVREERQRANHLEQQFGEGLLRAKQLEKQVSEASARSRQLEARNRQLQEQHREEERKRRAADGEEGAGPVSLGDDDVGGDAKKAASSTSLGGAEVLADAREDATASSSWEAPVNSNVAAEKPGHLMPVQDSAVGSAGLSRDEVLAWELAGGR